MDFVKPKIEVDPDEKVAFETAAPFEIYRKCKFCTGLPDKHLVF